MDTLTFWNDIGSTKDFEDPIYFEKLQPFLFLHSCIIEYGCGYGRVLQEFVSKGYQNVLGYDFAPKMLEKGHKLYPEISLNHINECGTIPQQNESVDVVILSTVLCCVAKREKQKKIITEIFRVLKPLGVLYLTDFLISFDVKSQEKYQKNIERYKDWGVYTTSEGAIVRHHTTQWIMQLLEDFDIQWFEQFDFKTMNNNSARTFHSVAQKQKTG